MGVPGVAPLFSSVSWYLPSLAILANLKPMSVLRPKSELRFLLLWMAASDHKRKSANRIVHRFRSILKWAELSTGRLHGLAYSAPLCAVIFRRDAEARHYSPIKYKRAFDGSLDRLLFRLTFDSNYFRAMALHKSPYMQMAQYIPLQFHRNLELLSILNRCIAQ